MKVQKFTAHSLRSIISHVHADHATSLIDARDKYILTNEKVISVEYDDHIGYGNYRKTKILVKEQGEDIKVIYTPHNGQQLDFTIRTPKQEKEVECVVKKTVILEHI